MLVLIEAVSSFRIRYVVEVKDEAHPEYALDTVSMEEAIEFSQYHIGEAISSSRVIDEDEVMRLYKEDNHHSWTKEQVMELYVTKDQK